jgi:RNA-directed DNA polymerase
VVITRCADIENVSHGLTGGISIILSLYSYRWAGGLKATVNDLHAALPDYRYVMKIDVKGYYESIDHTILLKQLDKDNANPFIWRLLLQVVKRSVERGGTFKSITCGISRGCPLSPVIAAYY